MSNAKWFFLGDRDFKELLRLTREYHRQAVRCEDAKAYLAGCTMAGAALEAALLAMVHLNAAEVEAAGLVPARNGKLKPLLSWSLAELLRTAKNMDWLPAGLELGKKWNVRSAMIGDYAEALRQVRNLVHPGRYLQDHSPSHVTKKYLAGSLEILDVARKYLLVNMHASLRKRLGISN